MPKQSKKWDVSRQERLLAIAGRHAAQLTARYEYTVDSEVIQSIHGEFGEPDCDARAVLYQLAALNVLAQQRESLRSGTFFRQRPETRQDNYKVCAKYPEVRAGEVEQIIVSIAGHFESGCKDVIDFCQRLAAASDRTALNFEKILHDHGIAEPARGGLLKLKSEYAAAAPLPIKSLLSQKRASKDVLDEINGHRSDAARLYVAADHNLPAIIRSTDGTGFGKSYAVFDQYLRNVNRTEPDIRHRNLLFITPHKAQIDIEKKLIDDARDAAIPILSILSRQDLTDLDYHDWVTKETNRDKFRRWIHLGKKCKAMGSDLSRLSFTIEQMQAGAIQLKNTNDYREKELLEKQLGNLGDRCLAVLKDLALAALNQNGKVTTIADLARSPKSLDQLKLEIVSRCIPLERALHQPCILLATTKKFDTHMQMLSIGRSGEYGIKLVDFYELIGACQADESLVTSAAVALNDAAQRVFLREQLFVADEANKFRENEVAFTVVIDEEHEAYQILAQERKVQLINADTNIAHVLSTLCRVHKSIAGAESASATRRPLYESARDFFLRVDELLRTKCELSAGQSMESLITLFESNIGYVQIEKGDVEQVINVTRNVFSFTPKRFFNEKALRSIRLRGCDSNTYCQIYFGAQGDSNPTLYDFFQLLMALLAAAAEINSKDFVRMLGNAEAKSQNASLALFITAAANKRREVKYLFDRSMDEEQVINSFFTYFQPKTVFSIEPKRKVEFTDPRLNEFVYVDFRLDLMLELPEVSIMRMAHNTKNAVYCLSATTGFASIQNGNYNHNVLRRYGEQGADNLGFKVIRRGPDDLPVLEGLRNARAKLRSVAFHPFSADGFSILGERVENDVSKLTRYWEQKLNPAPAIMRHRYHRREFTRQLQAILLAAYDGKNTLMLSLSGQIRTVFSNYLDGCQHACRALKRTTKGQQDIYDFTPFNNGITLRLIFFHAELERKVQMRDYTELSSPAQRLVIVAPYKSAGTGLNLFVTYHGTDFREDFNRLVLINSPFYSDVIQRDVGLNSIDNWLTLMKFYADGKRVKFLRDFDVNLVNGENYSVLMREHDMSIFKNLMQALGRVERVDSVLASEIFICSDLLDLAMMQFEHLGHPGNDVVLGSMSLINQSLREYCRSKSRAHSFATVSAREAFQKNVMDRQRRIDTFFHNNLREQIGRARTEDPRAANLNELLRSIDCIVDPAKWIASLKRNPVIASDPYLGTVIDEFYLRRNSGLETITFCDAKEKNGLSDIMEGVQLYLPARRVLPQYDGDLDYRDGAFWTRLTKLISLNDEAFKEWVPLPAMLPLLKGNVGEYLLDGFLAQYRIEALSLDEVFNKLAPGCYELFDRYIEIDDGLVCIDAKNWSSNVDQFALAQKVSEDAEKKMSSVRGALGEQYESIKFIYLNTRYEENPLNLMPEVDQPGAYYLNLLKRESGYEGQQGKPYSIKKDRLVLNRRLIELLTPYQR